MATRNEVQENTWEHLRYSSELITVKSPLRKILEEYSGIPAEKVDQHVWDVRERAFKIHPYPCIGQWRFTDLNLSLHPSYPEVLERLKQGQTFLDLGCCMGQDTRKLIYDGAPPAKKMYAAELRQDFIDIGFELFQDRDKLGAASTVFSADIFDPSSELTKLNGQIDVIWTGSFFHLFDWDQQVEVGKRVVEILRPQSNSLLLGRQRGTLQPGPSPHRLNPDEHTFQHDPESLERLWKVIGEATGTTWKVDAHLVSRDDNTDDPEVNDNRRRLIFAVRRV